MGNCAGKDGPQEPIPSTPTMTRRQDLESANEEALYFERFAHQAKQTSQPVVVAGSAAGPTSGPMAVIKWQHDRPSKPQSAFESYEKILQNVPSGTLWEDTDPPSLVPGKEHTYTSPYTFWEAQFFKKGSEEETAYDPSDIQQGAVGDCWFLAALAIVARHPAWMRRLCSRRDEEKGVYEFTFWKKNLPVRVCVDSNVPVWPPPPPGQYYTNAVQ
eukprot:TRINITY_DN20831_c0_g1_i2.p1 TRINITY_DN20831_c0_g1~~TRINITY_DN20831_c0_g1_i2.p1  ORF type:complete len:225 (-),score=38.48 TRINITY_DN20831_c0_g1_i2:77-721(-)